MARHYEADDLLEQGVMAELDGKPQPELFHRALQLFEETAKEMDLLDKRMEKLIGIHQRGKSTPAFDQSLDRILGELQGIKRVSLHGSRFANVARPPGEVKPRPLPTNLLAIMQAQREDLDLLRKQLAETIETFRAVIPLAEKNQFVPMMLSGRAGFSSKVQQSVDLLGEYSSFYSRTCMATIEATMQAYPAGFEWLPKVPAELGPTPAPNRQPLEERREDAPQTAPQAPEQAPPQQNVPPQQTPPKKDKGCQVADGTSSVTWLAALAVLAFLGMRRRRRG